MSTIQKVNFEPVSNMMQVQTRDFQLADGQLVNPLNSLVLIDGEWMNFDSAGKLVRAADVTAAEGTAASAISYPLWAEQGRTDIQAQGNRKAPLLWGGWWEFDTRVFKTTGVGALTDITAVGQAVTVGVIVIGSRKYVGIAGHDGGPQVGGTDVTPIVGYVTRLPVNNGGKLRIRGGTLY